MPVMPPAAREPGFPGPVSISLLTADCLFPNNLKVNNVGSHESRGWGTPERDADEGQVSDQHHRHDGARGFAGRLVMRSARHRVFWLLPDHPS